MGTCDFFERVRVTSADPAKAEIDGRFGAVLGTSQDDNGGWWYSVFIYEVKHVVLRRSRVSADGRVR